MTNTPGLRIGADLGGTNIAVGIVDEENRILSRFSMPTRAERPAAEVITDLCECVLRALSAGGLSLADCRSVGIGAPGTCNGKSGIIYRSYNLGWENVLLAKPIRGTFGLPVFVANDADCAALGEVKAGAAKGRKNVILITLGTGVGTGIVLDGKIRTGLAGSGGEMGHMVIREGGEPCTCGRRGCWEAYASATALIRRARKAAAEDPGSALNAAGHIGGKAVFDAAAAGDVTAQRVIDEFCTDLAVGTTNVINIFGPEMVLFGGGISAQGERILAPVRDYVYRNAFDRRPEALPELAAAAAGNDAGIIGAAALGE